MAPDPNKRRPQWFTHLRSGGLGRLRGRGSRTGQASGGSSAGAWPTPEEQAARNLGGQPLPPPWDMGASAQSGVSRRSPRTFWQRFQRAPRRRRVGMAAGAAGLVLLSLIGIVLLCSHLPLSGSGAPGAASASGDATATAAASTTATTTVTPAPFTITFTCASGAIKGTAKVCVHTEANASLSLTVRYCDGTYAAGRGIHGSVTSSKSGDYTWQFAVHTKCAGAATATVSAKSAGQTVTEHTTFTISR